MKALSVFRYSLKDNSRTVLIILLFFYARIIVSTIPLRFYFAKFESSGKIQISDLQPYQHDIRLFKRAAKIAPLSVTCIIYSIAMQLYFRTIYKIKLQINLGINSNEFGIMAHAWCLSNGDLSHYKKLEI